MGSKDIVEWKNIGHVKENVTTNMRSTSDLNQQIWMKPPYGVVKCNYDFKPNSEELVSDSLGVQRFKWLLLGSRSKPRNWLQIIIGSRTPSVTNGNIIWL